LIEWQNDNVKILGVLEEKETTLEGQSRKFEEHSKVWMRDDDVSVWPDRFLW
jgi:hypothetical protein